MAAISMETNHEFFVSVFFVMIIINMQCNECFENEQNSESISKVNFQMFLPEDVYLWRWLFVYIDIYILNAVVYVYSMFY